MAMAKGEAKRCWETCKSEYVDTFCRLGEVLLAFSNGLLMLVAFGTPFWVEQVFHDDQPSQHTYHSGLWQNCTELSCSAIPLSAPSYLIASRLFMVLALGGGIVAWVTTIVALLQHRARWLVCSAVCYTIQAIFMLVGLSVYSVTYNNKTSKLSWSYRVGWIACALSVGCAVYYVLGAIFRLRNPDMLPPGSQPKTYTPLAQFESTASDEDDENL